MGASFDVGRDCRKTRKALGALLLRPDAAPLLKSGGWGDFCDGNARE